jgi:hypothetical protein
LPPCPVKSAQLTKPPEKRETAALIFQNRRQATLYCFWQGYTVAATTVFYFRWDGCPFFTMNYTLYSL